ncbi:MAG: ATP-binding protein [Janthinobacterium lividum]
MLLMLTSIILVWGVALIWSYRQASHEVGEWDDARLVQLASLLARLDQNDLAALARTRIDARNEYLRPGHHSHQEDSDTLPREALFQVRDANGILTGSPALKQLGAWNVPFDPESGARTITLQGQVWHIFTLRDETVGRSVRVLESTNNRSDLVTGVARRIAEPIAWSLPIIALLVWISIGRSLSPLKSLSDEIGSRDINKLESIDMRRTPVEASPLVDAINHLLSRLQQSIRRERAFTADAAHELKTPLAAIKVQAQVALSIDDVAQQRLAMQRVVQGVDRSAHLAEQLLQLAHLDENEKLLTARVDLASTAGEAIAAHEQFARARATSICLLGDACLEVIADPALMSVLLDNLIDNALKYGHEGGHIEIEISRRTETALLIVRDDGPGVAAENRARLTDRFFRVIGNRASGSGLGLSIVARIVERFGAQLSFDEGIGGRGLAAIIAFPLNTGTDFPGIAKREA